MSPKVFRKIIQEINERDFALQLWDDLSKRAPRALVELVGAGYIAIGAVNDPVPNAFTHLVDQQGFAILFHSGLRDLIYGVARALSTRVAFTSKTKGAPPLRVTFEETSRVIGEVFWWYIASESAFGPNYPITDKQVEFASRLASEAEQFLLAHELGHTILHGLNPEDSGGTQQGRGQEAEFAADLIALRLHLGIYDDTSSPHRAADLAYAGAEFALQIFRSLERLKVEFTSTHPAAQDRLNALRSTLSSLIPDQSTLDEVTSLSQAVDRLFNGVVDFINDPGEYGRVLRAAAGQLAAELKHLLEDHSTGLLPDYVGFYPKAKKLLDRGYPYEVIRLAVDVTRDLASQLERLSQQEGQESSAAQKAYKQYKLLVDLAENGPEPFRSLLIGALSPSK